MLSGLFKGESFCLSEARLILIAILVLCRYTVSQNLIYQVKKSLQILQRTKDTSDHTTDVWEVGVDFSQGICQCRNKAFL
jgi:hypothetical protein